MSRNYIYSGIIIVGFILTFIIQIWFISYLAELETSLLHDETLRLIAFVFIGSFILTSPFFVIVIKYFNNDKLLSSFAMWNLIGRTLFTMNFSFMLFNINIGLLIYFVLLLSSAAAIGSVVIAFKILFDLGTEKKYAYSIVFIALAYLLFESGISIFVDTILNEIFGLYVNSIINILVFVFVLVVEVYVIFYLSDYFSSSNKIKIEKGEIDKKVKKNAYERTTL